MNNHAALARPPEPSVDIRRDVFFTRRMHLRSRQILRRPHHTRVRPDEQGSLAASPIHNPERIRFIRVSFLNEADPLPHVRTHLGFETPRPHDRLLVADDRVSGKRTHERVSIAVVRARTHAKLVKVLARAIRHRVQDDVAISGGLVCGLKGHTNGVSPINDKALANNRETIGVAINPVSCLLAQQAKTGARKGRGVECHVISRTAKYRQRQHERRPHLRPRSR